MLIRGTIPVELQRCAIADRGNLDFVNDLAGLYIS
jgi:hypothetical protein